MFLLNRAKRKVIAACLLVGVFLLPLVSPFISKVYAANSATWVNQATIDYNGVKYKEDDAGDNNWHFYAANPQNGCQQEIKDFTHPGYDSADGPYKTQTVTLYKQKAVAGGCSEDGTEDIQLQANPPGYNVAFVWKDDKNIESVDGKKKFSQDSSGNFISVNDTSSCKDFITVGSDKTQLSLTVRSNQSLTNASGSLGQKYNRSTGSGWPFVRDITSAGDVVINGDKCHESKPVTATADAANAARQGQSVLPGATGATGKDNSCESAGKLGWLVCPVIEILDGIFNWLDTQIQALLEVNQNAYQDNDLYNAWSNVRNIAYLILIPIMLVMVIGTAMGSELFSAYTVKKAMPRMVAAILFITLSWYICGFLINLSNVVGSGVLGLMTSPFGVGGKITLGSLFNPGVGQAVGVGGVAAGVGLGAFLAGGFGALMGILLLYFAVAVLFIFLAFLVLTARQLFILALLVVAPLAILAWIFPGNDKLWKTWWSSFSKLLIMYPLITGLIAIGRIFSYLIGHTPAGGPLEGPILNPLLKITAYIIPYALIPLTFKFAGGTFATFSGMVNDRGKGLFGKMKQGRQKRYERAGRQVTQARADRQVQWQQRASSTTGLRSALFSQAAKRVGGYNAQAADAARRVAVKKEVEDQINTGRDGEIRGLTVNKQEADATEAARQIGEDAQGNAIYDRDVGLREVLRRINSDGRRQYKSLGGGWVDEEAVDEGRRRWGRDTYAQQAALSYEMRKAATDEEVAGLGERYQALATTDRSAGGWQMTGTQASGALTGAGFENQNTHMEFKHMRTNGTMDYAAFSREMYEKKGTYPLGQMSAHTIDQLREGYDHAQAMGDTETMERIAQVAEMHVTRYGGGAVADGDPSDPASMAAADAARQAARAAAIAAGRDPDEAAAGVVQTNSPGAVHVQEAIRKLAIHTGRYAPLNPAQRDVLPPIDIPNRKS